MPAATIGDARVVSARVTVVAVDWRMDAIAVNRIAIVVGAQVAVVIAVDGQQVVAANERQTFVCCTCVIVVAVFLVSSARASKRIAHRHYAHLLYEAGVTRVRFATARVRVALTELAQIEKVTLNFREDAASLSVARVCGAQKIVVADDGGVNARTAGCNRNRLIACVNRALIHIIAVGCATDRLAANKRQTGDDRQQKRNDHSRVTTDSATNKCDANKDHCFVCLFFVSFRFICLVFLFFKVKWEPMERFVLEFGLATK